MLKKIKLHIPQSVTDNVLIRQEQVTLHHQIREVQKKAEKKAQQEIAAAHSIAQQFVDQGYGEGYVKGFTDSLQAVIQYLLDSERILIEYRENIEKEIHLKLTAVLHSSPVITALITEWAGSLVRTEGLTLILHLPEHTRACEAELLTALEAASGIKAELYYHPKPNFVVQYGKQIAEFVPEITESKLASSTMEQYKTSSQQMVNLSNEAVASVIRKLESSLHD